MNAVKLSRIRGDFKFVKKKIYDIVVDESSRVLES